MADHRQGGFSSVLVIAAVVLMSSLMVFGITVLTSVQSGYTQELSSTRANQAALAGLDWARYQIARPAVPLCPASQNVAMPGTLAPYTVTVRCTDNSPAAGYTEGATTVRVYLLEATACTLPGGAVNCTPLTTSNGADFVKKTLATWAQR